MYQNLMLIKEPSQITFKILIKYRLSIFFFLMLKQKNLETKQALPKLPTFANILRSYKVNVNNL